MSAALLNYTTTISVAKTLGEVTARLFDHGATQVNTQSDGAGTFTGIFFAIKVKGGLELGYRLPVNVEAVYLRLAQQAQDREIPPRFATREQATRVAWRILKDWVEAQVALIETGMVSTEEVFLPYMLAAPNKTVFELMSESQFALPSPDSRS